MLLRRTCDNEQTILFIVHQPSSKLFQVFDRLLLLGEAGKTLYFGEIGVESAKLIECFEQNGAAPCEAGQNRAEWIFNITKRTDQIGSPQSHPRKDWYNVWSESQHREKVLRHIEELKHNVLRIAKAELTPKGKSTQ